MHLLRAWTRGLLGTFPLVYRLVFGLYRVVQTILRLPRHAARWLIRVVWIPLVVCLRSKQEKKAWFSGPLASEPDTFALYRILGNDIPPRHGQEQTFANLKFTLENEPELQDCTKIWVLNRIVDPGQYARLEGLLKQHGKEYLTIPFSRKEYIRVGFQYDGVPGTGVMLNKASDPQSRIHRLVAEAYVLSKKNLYTMNINGSKNVALADGKHRAKWVLPWDGNCFITGAAWQEIRAAVKKRPWTRYFIVPMARVPHNQLLLSDDFVPEGREEPQILFRRDAAETFNESFPYGQQNKMELLRKLGVPGPWMHCAIRLHPWEKGRKPVSRERYRFARCGWVARLNNGNPAVEKSAEKRWAARKQGVISFLKELDLSIWSERSGTDVSLEGEPGDHLNSGDDKGLSNAPDHRGVWSDLRMAEQAVQQGDLHALHGIAMIAGLHLKEQIDKDGRLVMEVIKKNPAWHCVQALKGWFRLAGLLENRTGVDLWRFESDGRGSIGKAMDWLIQIVREQRLGGIEHFELQQELDRLVQSCPLLPGVREYWGKCVPLGPVGREEPGNLMETLAMSTKPLVSVIIPCFNSAAFVSRAIDSVLRQTWPQLELILVDNNSSDGTHRILEEYQEQFRNKIRVYREEKEGGSAARNKGIKEARGEWIQFLDSDDELLPGKIECQLDYVRKGVFDVAAGSYQYIKSGKGLKKPVNHDPWAGLVTSSLGITSANLWKTETVKRIGGFESKQDSSQEYELMFRMLKAGAGVVAVDEAHTLVYYQPESIGKPLKKAGKVHVWQNLFDLRLDIRDHLVNQGLFFGKLRFAWENYMYRHLVYLKYSFPEVYAHYMPLLRHNLPLLNIIRPVIGREVRRFFKPHER